MTTPLPWITSDAACLNHDPSLWDDENATDTREAKRICQGCPLRIPCVEWALENREHGVWGGTSEAQRRQLGRGPRRDRDGGPEIQHGTEAGAREHYRRGGRPCEDCLTAARVAAAARRAKAAA